MAAGGAAESREGNKWVSENGKQARSSYLLMHRWSRLAANWSSYQLHHPKRQVSPLLILSSLKRSPPLLSSFWCPWNCSAKSHLHHQAFSLGFLHVWIYASEKFRFMWWNHCRHPERIHFHLVLPPKLRPRVKPLKAFFRNVNIEIPRYDYFFWVCLFLLALSSLASDLLLCCVSLKLVPTQWNLYLGMFGLSAWTNGL